MSPPDPSAIAVEGLEVCYGDVVAVDGLDLSAERGEVVALLGRNGAGKTSTVETMEGYRRASAGTVRVLGVDPATADGHRHLSSRIGVMLQKGGVYPSMSPRDVLRLFSSYYDRPVDPEELIGRLGLDEVAGTPWRRLSGGEQQRLSLGLALVGSPEVAFLDEPTAGVDPQGRVAIRDEISALRAEGACVLLTTHELDEAERIADRVVIIDRGRVVAQGTVAELTSADSTTRTRFGAVPGLDVAGLAEALGVPVTEDSPGEYSLDAACSPQVVAGLTRWLAERNVTLKDLHGGRQRLEDVFLRLTDGRGA